MLNYILQVVLFQLLFLVIYEAFLKKETFFQWNRFYLLFSAVLSYIIPFIRIKMLENYIPNQIVTSNLTFDNLSESALKNTDFIIQKTNYFTLSNLYYLGLIMMSILFVYKLIHLIKKIYSNRIIPKKEYKLVVIEKEKNAFSFFTYIFLGNEIYKKEHQHILQHELVHVKEKHSLDLLFFELQKILFWFNPLVYIYQYKISVLHEYIADKKTIKNSEKTTFYENLLLQSFNIETLPFVNQYYKKSLLKKRIMMATKNKSRQILKMKYLLVLPLLLMMLIIASCEKENPTDKTETEKIASFATIKKAPIFPGCEDLQNKEETKTCFNQKMQRFIAKNFDIDLAKNLGLPAGKHKIMVQFIIDENGNISDILSRAPHPKLKEEAIKTIGKLPKMIPGIDDNNKKVAVRYNLPIIFKIEESNIKKIHDENMENPPAPPTPTKAPTPVNPEQDKKKSFINGISGKYILLPKKELNNVKISSAFKNDKIVSFKVKVIKKPSYSINGNQLDAKIIEDIKKAPKDSPVVIFKIKTSNGNELNPITFKVK